jgi:hypothetical protein
MGVSRLLAKGWIAFCVFAGAYQFAHVAIAGAPILQALLPLGVTVLLFGAMGLLFIAGYGLSASHRLPRIESLRLTPGFNEIVFLCFVALSFLVEIAYRPGNGVGGVIMALEAAMRLIPGQHALADALDRCNLDGGREFSAAFSWLLAFIYLGSSASRLRMAAALLRIERKQRPDPLGPFGVGLALGIAAVVGIQFLFIGTLYTLLPCSLLGGVLGGVLMGLAPLALAYLVSAALTNLLAANSEG